MHKSVPNSGKARDMVNSRTGAPWQVSYDPVTRLFFHQAIGNLRNIRRDYYSPRMEPHLIPAGTN